MAKKKNKTSEKAGKKDEAGQRLERLEQALAESEEKRRKLKKRVDRLEEALADLEEVLDEDADVDDDEDVEDKTSAAPSGHRELSRPDETWTAARLREAATSRGLTGVSRLSKAKLLEALRSAS